MTYDRKTKGSANDADKAVGARIRDIRIARGVSMQKLAKKIDVTYQQLQKYEIGSNRISAGRLQSVAQALHVTPNDFFAEYSW